MLQRCGKKSSFVSRLTNTYISGLGVCFFAVVFCLFVLVWFYSLYSLTREVQSNIVRQLDSNVKGSAEPVEFFCVLSIVVPSSCIINPVNAPSDTSVRQQMS